MHFFLVIFLVVISYFLYYLQKKEDFFDTLSNISCRKNCGKNNCTISLTMDGKKRSCTGYCTNNKNIKFVC